MPQPARRVGAYAKLLATYAADDAIIAAGEAAELLFVRGLAFCATSDADGYITDAQVLRYVGAGMRDAEKRAKRLAEVGLWERVEGGYQVRSWTKIHETSDEKGRRRKADRDRKLVRSDDATDSGAVSERIPPGIQTEGSADSLSLIHNTTDTETGHSLPRKRGTRIPPDWKPGAELVAAMRSAGIPDDLARRELPKFRDYWTAKSGREAVKVDWDATWRNWLRNANEYRGGGSDGPAKPFGGW